MKTNFKHLFLTIICIAFATVSFAQKSKKDNGVGVAGDANSSTMTVKQAKKYYKVDSKKFLQDWNLIIHGGATVPFTDLRSYDWFRQTKKPSELQWDAGIGLTKMFNSAFGLNIDYTLGKISGRTVEKGGFAEDRQYWKQLGFDQPIYFKTSIFHMACLSAYIDWMGIGMGYNSYIKSKITGKPVKARRFAVYTKLGIGFWRGSSQIYNVKDDKPIANNQYTRGFTNKFTEVVFPLAMGMKFKVTKMFDIGVESQFVVMNSDKLDAFNFTGSNTNGKVVNSLSKINRDAFADVSIQFIYKFGRIGAQKEHVEWVNPLAFIMADQKTEKKKDELKDTDGDGVLDILDKEPTTPEGYAVDAHGVTLDSDKDGCPDTKDPEPFSSPAFEIVDCKNVIPKVETPPVTEPGKSGPPYDEEPLVKRVKTVEENLWKLTSIYYDLNKYSITTPANAELKKVGLVMATNPDLKVNVQGHTDTRGSVEYNDKLSQNRVNAAIKYLKDNYGISEDRFIKLPLGKTDPLVKDAASEGQHQVNRRVDFTPAKQ